MAFIQLEKVTFQYSLRSEDAITNLSLNIEKGQFVVLFGSSGSGKSTLLRLLKNEIQPHGNLRGELTINGEDISIFDSKKIGFVFQDPENQLVADDVLHELAFGLENMGVATSEMRSRIAEMVHFFGAENLLNKKTFELSGGRKQQMNLASVLLMQPEILLLDEPTSQLDPVSAREFLDMLVRLNEEFGMTIILAEHRLEEIFTIADKIVLMEKGSIKVEGEPRQLMGTLWESEYQSFVPTIPNLYLKHVREESRTTIPLSVKEGRKWVTQLTLKENAINSLTNTYAKKNKIIEIKDLYFRYSKEDHFILQAFDFSLDKGEFYALMGGNGSGKSTLLKIIMGIVKPTKGKVLYDNQSLHSWKNREAAQKIGYLPQNPKIFFLHDTLEKELEETMNTWGVTNVEEVDSLLELLGINHLRVSHPYDLSGGELQKAALACLLLRKPEVLLLDEPTKGLDPVSKENLAKLLCELKDKGLTIIMSTHDVEFAASYTTKCGMIFQGNITSENIPKEFFKGNFFYTTMVQRVFRNQMGGEIVTKEEVHF
jgi:energy-coupling factor transport system ATP-binding protein